MSVRIPLGAWMFASCNCGVIPGRAPCEELITRPEKSHRLCCITVCDPETSRKRRPQSALGRSATGKWGNSKQWQEVYLFCKTSVCILVSAEPLTYGYRKVFLRGWSVRSGNLNIHFHLARRWRYIALFVTPSAFIHLRTLHTISAFSRIPQSHIFSAINPTVLMETIRSAVTE